MANTATDVFRNYDMTTGNDSCWKWKGQWGGRERDKRPYFNYEGKRVIAYRLVYELVTGEQLIPTQLILHSCDNGGYPVGCGNPNHIRVGDNKANMSDMTERQRHGLPHNTVKAIRRLLDAGKKQEEIAELYGISREQVSAIKTGRAYSHIKEDNEDEGQGTDTEAATDGSGEGDQGH